MLFKDKVVLVTGASSGIGAAIGVAFSTEGAKVVMVGRNESKLTKVASQCPQSLVLLADVANDDDVRRIVDQTIKTFDHIDILINNAGFTRTAGILDSDMMEAYDSVMNVNVRGLIHLTTLAAPYLVKTKGNIINISSVAAHITPSTTTRTINYYTSKAAVSHFGACAAAESAPHGVRVNTVSPGPVNTDFIENSNSKFTWDDLKQKTSLNRVSDPKEIADLILFLASDKAKSITGSDYVSDNGLLIKRV